MSFAFGVFVCSLPTLGTGLILFALISKVFDAVNRVALFASVLILNPFVKPIYYVGSISLGALIFTGSFKVGADPSSLLLYLIVGNIIIGFLSAVVAYYASNIILDKYESRLNTVRKDVIKKIEGGKEFGDSKE